MRMTGCCQPAAALLSALLLLGGCSGLRVIFPSHDHDTDPPDIPELSRPAVLVLSKTNGFRHEEAIPAAHTALEAIAKKRGWSLFATENGAVINDDDLTKFDVVVFQNTSGPILSETQETALRSWVEKGGGFVGIHGAGGDPSYEWGWYGTDLIGAQFTGHPMGPQFQEATVIVEDSEHPASKHLPANWVRTDEWYSFEESPRNKGVRVLAKLDETTYSPEMHLFYFINTDLRMGEDHPVLWSQCIGEGRSLYSAMGHAASAYEEELYVGVLEGGIAWAAGLEGDC
ncbi:MAG: ThuA domain-containing protein [Candidatus Binatia bacterium]|nr:ThuA domain-containing protein [Candidatus Binatia bacterium]